MKTRLRALALGLLGLSAAGFALVQPRAAVDIVATAPVLEAVYAPPAEAVDAHVLHRGETVSELFGRAALGGGELNDAILALREHVDPRRLLPNTTVLVRRWTEDGSPRSVDVRLNADSTVRLRRRPAGWRSEVVVTPTVVDTLFLAGQVGPGGSVYRTVMDHPDLDLPRREREALIWQLAHIYGWELDFTHDLRPDDTFRVVYEREARPDGTSRASKVLVAEIVTAGRPLAAIFFDPGDGRSDYFNREGRSLRLTFRRYPVDFPRITSSFSSRRYHPVLKRNRPHLGTDYGADRGTPVRTTADGVISAASWDGGYGNLVRINHGNGYETRYAHLSRFGAGIRPGQRVKQGEIIGYVGETGLATGPHLHYELRHHGKATDASRVRLPAAPPVPAEHMENFRLLTRERDVLLSAVSFPRTNTLPSD